MPCQTLIGQILIQRALFPEIRNEFSNRKFLFLKKLNHSLTIFFCALVFTCVDVRLMTCARFGRDQACTKVDASFFPFAPLTPSHHNLSDVHLLLKQRIGQWNHSLESLQTVFFWRFACTCESVWPPNASLHASSTCGYSRVRLARAYNTDEAKSLGSTIPWHLYSILVIERFSIEWRQGNKQC